MCDDRLFAPQLEYFSRDFDVRVGCLKSADSISAIAQAVLSDTTTPVFDVAGLSMGGIVAMELMRQAPERVGRVVLLDTNHLPDTDERRTLRRRQIADVRAGRLRDVIVEEMKPNYLACQNRGDAKLLDLLVDMAMSQGDAAFVNQSVALMHRRDYSDVLRDWWKPVLLICGAEDALCPPERHRQMVELLRDGRLELVPDAGHISTLEQPNAVNSLIDRYLTRSMTEAAK